MTRYFAAFATAGVLVISGPAVAQTTKHHATKQPASASASAESNRVSLTGCISASEQPNGFSLSVTSSDTAAAAAQPSSAGSTGTQAGSPNPTGTAGTAATSSAAGSSSTAASISQGSHVQLIGDTTSLTQLANRKVQVTGVVVPQHTARAKTKAKAKTSASTDAATATPETTVVRVERIERLADSCDAGK